MAQTEQPQQPMPSTGARTLNRHHFPCNQAALVEEDDHEVDPLVAKISARLPQAEAPRLLGNQRCDPEEAQERDSLLETHLELMTDP